MDASVSVFKQTNSNVWAACAQAEEPVLHHRPSELWKADSHQLLCLKRTYLINQRVKQQVIVMSCCGFVSQWDFEFAVLK